MRAGTRLTWFARATALAVLLVFTGSAGLRAQARGAPDPGLLDGLRAYASRYAETITSVVAHEHFVQSVTIARSAPKSMELRADVLMLRLPGEPQPVWFRDVYEVDGRKVRDRDERLFRLLELPAAGRLDAARRIAAESARYNLGRVPRTTNVPDLVFDYVLAPAGHLGLTVSGEATIDRQRVVVLKFVEKGSPSIVRSPSGRDVQARGRLWIAADTAAVVRSEVILGDMQANNTTTVEFAEHPRLPVRVPARMDERYRAPGELGRGIATYSDVRVFGVATTEQIRKPPPAAARPAFGTNQDEVHR